MFKGNTQKFKEKTKKIARSILIAGFMAWLGVFLDAEALAKELELDAGALAKELEFETGSFTIQFENDRIANRDRHYTHGTRLSWTSEQHASRRNEPTGGPT